MRKTSKPVMDADSRLLQPPSVFKPESKINLFQALG
jgi:hypothetical protein